MANVNTTLSRAQSKPELFALWFFKSASNWRLILALLLIVALTIISITFNVLLGQLSGADSISEVVLPIGYALLDLSAPIPKRIYRPQGRFTLQKGAFLALVWIPSLPQPMGCCKLHACD